MLRPLLRKSLHSLWYTTSVSQSRCSSQATVSIQENIKNKRKRAQLGGGQKRIDAQHKKVRCVASKFIVVWVFIFLSIVGKFKTLHNFIPNSAVQVKVTTIFGINVNCKFCLCKIFLFKVLCIWSNILRN